MAIILNADVLALICDQFEMNFNFMWRLGDRQKTLLSLALTSKDFSTPALNVLWRNLYSLEPLLSILPETTLLDGKFKVIFLSFATGSVLTTLAKTDARQADRAFFLGSTPLLHLSSS